MLIEKPSRRTELAVYCLGHALQSLALRATSRGLAPRMRRADALMLSLSSSVIMHWRAAPRRAAALPGRPSQQKQSNPAPWRLKRLRTPPVAVT